MFYFQMFQAKLVLKGRSALPQMEETKEGKYMYGKCSKTLNTFLFLLSIKMLVIWAVAHKMR